MNEPPKEFLEAVSRYADFLMVKNVCAEIGLGIFAASDQEHEDSLRSEAESFLSDEDKPKLPLIIKELLKS